MAHLLDHCAGLVFGFVFRGGTPAPVADDTLAGALAGGHDWVWLHLALSDHRARRFLESYDGAPAQARALMLDTEDRIQFHLAPGGAWGILPDIERDFDGEEMGAGRLAFWLDGRHLFTARRHPVRAAETLRDSIVEGLSPKDPADALAHLQGRYVELAESRLSVLAADLGRIEDAVLADRFSSGRDTGQEKLGPLRRELSRHAREFSSLRSAIHRATSARHGEISSPLGQHLPLLLQQAEDFDRDAGALQERARLLYEEIETRIASTTNRSLSALTVISTLLLPPTFVVGAFGMNVEGLPWSHDKEGFAIVIGFCVVLIGVGYAVLRRFRILP